MMKIIRLSFVGELALERMLWAVYLWGRKLKFYWCRSPPQTMTKNPPNLRFFLTLYSIIYPLNAIRHFCNASTLKSLQNTSQLALQRPHRCTYSFESRSVYFVPQRRILPWKHVHYLQPRILIDVSWFPLLARDACTCTFNRFSEMQIEYLAFLLRILDPLVARTRIHIPKISDISLLIGYPTSTSRLVDLECVFGLQHPILSAIFVQLNSFISRTWTEPIFTSLSQYKSRRYA
jgi:hypothetical protein